MVMPKTREPPDHTAVILRHAQEVADMGDRWFVSAAFGIQRAGRWARREAEIIGDSAKAAFHTTVRVGRHMVGAPVEDAGADGPASHTQPAVTAGSGDDVHGQQEEAWPPRRRPWTGVGIVGAMPLGRPAAEGRETGEQSGHGADPSEGRVPLLLRILGQVVSEYGPRGYERLEADERLWTLVHLLQVRRQARLREQGFARPRADTSGGKEEP